MDRRKGRAPSLRRRPAAGIIRWIRGGSGGIRPAFPDSLFAGIRPLSLCSLGTLHTVHTL